MRIIGGIDSEKDIIDSMGFVERQYVIVEDIHGRLRELGGVKLSKGISNKN